MKLLIKPKIEGVFYDEALRLLKASAIPLEETRFVETLNNYDKDVARDGSSIPMGPRYTQENFGLRIEHTFFDKAAKVTIDAGLDAIIFEEAEGYSEGSARLVAAGFMGFLAKQLVPYEVKYQHFGLLVKDIAALDQL